MPPVVELRLVPTPGAKPEFLCAVEPIPKEGTTAPPKIWPSIVHNQRNKVIVLEGYTREPWAMDVNTGAAATTWSSFQVHSVDGRNKLPGFVKYLRERQKTCFGRFVMEDNQDNKDSNPNPNPTTFVWIISHKQTSSSRLSCRVAPIHSIPNCNLRPKSTAAAAAVPNSVAAGRNRTETTGSNAGGSSKPKKKGFGLLGNLVGAQRRTNHQVVKASTKATRPQISTTTAVGSQAQAGTESSGEHPTAGDASETNDAMPLSTSGQVLSDFRHEMEQKMLDFDISPEVSTKISLRLADHTKKVREEDKGKITMEVLKYIVYEQAEEVNEEWIAHKEPSEFTDEFTVAIYKDAESAPPEVIEEMNQAEIPEEMKAQQKMIEQRRRQEETNTRRIQEALQRQALKKMAESSGGAGGQGLSALNTEKRDLRTIEEIQQDSAKRRKIE
eukprot:jgi/Psemu1/9942/gm1.9942_g